MIKKNILVMILAMINVSENLCAQMSSQQAQQIYLTTKGHIAISMKYNDSALIAVSNQLIVTLDYETGEIIFRVAYQTFHTGIDSLDNKLKSLKTQEMHFKGKLNIFINTKKKSPQKYNMTGLMNSTIPPTIAEGNGTVLCMAPSDSYSITPSCVLTLTMKFTLSGLGLTDVFRIADNAIRIDVRQSLLGKEKVN
jgi:hypothetical protein